MIPGQQAALVKVEKGKAAVSSLFGDKAAIIRKYIDGQKLTCKNEQDIVQVFTFYSTL
jgi:hypothetical protein